MDYLVTAVFAFTSGALVGWAVAARTYTKNINMVSQSLESMRPTIIIDNGASPYDDDEDDETPKYLS